MPAVVATLERWGVRLTEGLPLTGVRFVASGRHFEACFGARTALGLRRQALIAALWTRASELGAELRLGHSAASWVESHNAVRVRTTGPGGSCEIVARWLVGADGLRSRTRRRMGWEPPAARPSRLRYGLSRHFDRRPWSNFVEVHLGSGREAYVTPLGAQRVGVAMLSRGLPAPFEAQLATFQSLSRRLSGCRRGPVRGAGPFLQQPRAVCGGRVALVGDAAGYCDAITGEGVALALAGAERLVASLAAQSLERYPGELRRLTRPNRWLTAGLLTTAQSPVLRWLAMAGFAAVPGLPNSLLAKLGSCSAQPAPDELRPR